MPDDLYDHDILAWSESQAALLRRLARGERVNDLDWAHLIEEIEDVGLSELRSVESFLVLMMVHLLKLRAWPDDPAERHWRGEVVAFQRNAERRFVPSMRQRLDLARLWRDAVDQVAAGAGDEAVGLPAECPFTVEGLLTCSLAALTDTVCKGD
jgi:hypothetical protein